MITPYSRQLVLSSRKIPFINKILESIMKHLVFLALLFGSNIAYAAEAKSNEKNDWNATSLTEEVIKKIQQSQFQYKKCVTDEMQKEGYYKFDSRNATDAIIKQCENVLSNMRRVYLDSKVPGVIADRHLKKMRIDITRRVLKQLMFAEAAKKTGR